MWQKLVELKAETIIEFPCQFFFFSKKNKSNLSKILKKCYCDLQVFPLNDEKDLRDNCFQISSQETFSNSLYKSAVHVV